MHAPLFDPYRAQRRCLWRNRAARWRQAPGETVFHAIIWLALAVLTGMAVVSLTGRRDLADGLLALTQSAPWAWLLAWGGVMAMQVRLGLVNWQTRDASGWLSVQPIATQIRRRERWRLVLRHIAPHGLAGVAMFAFLRVPWLAWIGLGVMLTAAPMAGMLWARWNRSHAAPRPRTPNDHFHAPSRHDRGRGCLWRWQVREAFAGVNPRTLRRGLWILLLIPVGVSAFTAALALATGLILAAYLAAWRRCLAVWVQAEHWLGAQPSRARFWLSGLIVPAVLATLGASATGCALAALGAVRVAPWVGSGLLALAMLQALCTLALRREPARIALIFVLHLGLLGAALQVFAPLVMPVWLAMCLRLAYRGVRP